MATNTPEGTMKLGQTNGFSYISFRPPLSAVDRYCIPLPNSARTEDSVGLFWQEERDDGTLDMGLRSDSFSDPEAKKDTRETFTHYAGRVATYLGGYQLDTVIRTVEPEAVASEVEANAIKWETVELGVHELAS